MRDKEIPGSTQEWLSRAKSDLAFAAIPLPEGALYENLCFFAQQAAEKSIKAVYKHYEWMFHYTHDIEELLIGLTNHGLEIPPELKEAITLTDYAWGARYPGFNELVTAGEYREAYRLAEMVVSWAEKEIRKEG